MSNAIDKRSFADDSQAINKIKNRLGISHLVLLNQHHSSMVHSINTVSKDQIFEMVGDGLVTNKQGVGLGVITADCLPIILYDAKQEVIAVAHAGWRGSLLGIVEQTINRMIQKYNSALDSIHFFLGPAGRYCCYEVGLDVISKLADMQLNSKPIVHTDHDSYFLDLVHLNSVLLNRLGISSSCINTSASVCTICNPQFCSYRRYGKGYALRQLSVVTLGFVNEI